MMRQRGAPIDEEHLGFAHRLTGHGAMLGRSDLRELRGVAERPLEQPEPELDRQDPPHGIVDPRHRHLAVVDVLLQPGDELAVACSGTIIMSIPALTARLDVLQRVAGQLVDPVPVGHDDPAEAQLPFEHVGDQMLVAVHLLPVQAVVGDHDRSDAGLDRGDVPGHVQLSQRRFAVDDRVASIDAVTCPAVADEVLGGRRGPSGRGHVGALETADRRASQRFGELRGFAESLVGAAPALVLRNRDTRREVPVHPRAGDLGGRHPRRLLDDLRVARAPRPML